MKPWEILDRLSQEDPEVALKSLKPDDPFWLGASYAIDPFVGMIVRRPMWDPRSYGEGVSLDLFEKIAKAILDGKLVGDQLAIILERFSRAATEPEWTRWYRPILKGELILPFGLDLYNKYAPERLQPPALNKPKAVALEAKKPDRYFVQPLYEGFVFWLVQSKTEPIEVRGYDGSIRRISHSGVEARLGELAHKTPMDIVLTGFLNGDEYLVEDLLTRDQFTRESAVTSLKDRLMAAVRLGLPVVQMSDEFSGKDLPSAQFWKELHLINQQGFKSVVFRDLDGKYPFRVQADTKLSPAKFAKAIKETKDLAA